MVAGILAEGLVIDRPLAPHRADEAVVLQGVEGHKVQIVPGASFKLRENTSRLLKPLDIWLSSGDFRLPVFQFDFLRGFTGYSKLFAEGDAEFFTSSPRYTASVREIIAAAFWTDAMKLRPSGTHSISAAVSFE